MSRPSVDKQLERLLVLVPWVMSHDEGPTVEEVCSRFDLSEAELVDNLELLFMCGLYPFTPDTLIEADIVDGRVWIRSAEAFDRPPFFRPAEAVALVAATTAVLELPGNENNDTLRNALAKLIDVLGVGSSAELDVKLSQAEPAVLDSLRRAVETRHVAVADYYSYGRGVWTHRRLHPLRVFNSEGQWYAQAIAPEAGANSHRNFRLDRMRNVSVLDETFEPPASLPPARIYEARPGDPTLVLDLDAGGRWIAEQYPVHSVTELPDGVVRVALPVSERLWAERLLLRLGKHARVVAGDIDPEESARKILRRYQSPMQKERS